MKPLLLVLCLSGAAVSLDAAVYFGDTREICITDSWWQSNWNRCAGSWWAGAYRVIFGFD